ncbi:hypothetical protein Tco_0692038 [Tanacetum coccineum]
MISIRKGSIEAAYAAHPTPDVFINFASVRRYMALLQVAGSHINGWERHASRTKSAVVSAKKSVALYNVFPISAPSNTHPNTPDSNKPNFQHIADIVSSKLSLYSQPS